MRAYNKKKRPRNTTKFRYKCDIKIGFLIGCNKLCKRIDDYKRYKPQKVLFCN